MQDHRLQDHGKKDLSWGIRTRHALLFILRHFKPSSKRLENSDFKLRKKLAQKLSRQKERGQVHPIPRVKDISPQEFKKKYAGKGIPVIIEGGCKDWPCSKKWDLDFLENEFGEEEFNLSYQRGFTNEDEKPQGPRQNGEVFERLTVKQLVQDIRTQGKKYMRFCPIMEKKRELIEDLDESWLKKMRITFLGHSYQSFIGAKGRKTPLHCGMTAFFFILPYGRKKWTFVHPSYNPLLSPAISHYGHAHSDIDMSKRNTDIYPGSDLIDTYEGELNEGDILYGPAWMWHEVENLTDTWGVSYRFAHMAQTWKQSLALTFKRFFLTKPSVFTIFYYSFIKTNVAEREKHLLTPKVYRD